MIKKILLLLALLAAFHPAPAHAATALDYSAFRMIPVLHEGRLKPLDTFARVKLKEYSGADTIGGRSAVEWLAETLFDPATAEQRPLFVLRDPDLKERLGLEKNKKLFSLPEIQTALEQSRPQIETLAKAAPGTLTPPQAELLRLYDNALDAMALLRSVTMILPLSVEIPARYKAATPDYLGLLASQRGILKELKTLIRRKGENLERYTDEEKHLAVLAFSLQKLEAAGAQSLTFKIIPPPSGTKGGTKEWLSPWQSIRTANPVLGHWRGMAAAWHDKNTAAWRQESDRTFSLMAGASPRTFSPAIFTLEVLYNMIRPFHVALALYTLAIALTAIDLFRPGTMLQKPLWIALWSGLAAHGAGIAVRMTVLQRPPVGTLYEAVVFVSFLCAALTIFLARRRPFHALLLPGLVAAAFLMAIAPRVLQKAESMDMLVAVLNTNFWLSTHVLCITAGYALSVLAAGLAHAYLLMRALRKNHEAFLRFVYIASLAALLLTALGTALGGIWADQSWGRFWGWDPKENGALMIVLWLIWLQHGKISGHLQTIPYMAGTAFLNVIVALAWFGVNLLNVGLHSYGFTRGLAAGLTVFCTLEILAIAGLWLPIYMKERTHAA